MQPSQVFSKWWLPIDISTHGDKVDLLITVVHVLMFALFIGWGTFFGYCLVKFRARPGQKASYHVGGGGISKAVELVVLGLEILFLFAFSMPVWASLKREFPKESEATNVHIVAQRFEWIFHYPGKDGRWGKMNPPPLMDDTDNILGINWTKDPDAKDDFVSRKVLFVKAGGNVIAHLSSKDVIHSFKVPVLRFTQDAIPGTVIPFWFKTKDDARGMYEIACAQLCGNQHTSMKAFLVVLSPEDHAAMMGCASQTEFDRWKAAYLGVHPLPKDRYPE